MPKAIKQKSAHESHNTLGCIKNPSMQTKDQASELREKAERISQLTCPYGLRTDTTRKEYFSIFLLAVQCPLTSSYMSR